MPAIISGRNNQIWQPTESGFRDRYGIDQITYDQKIPKALFAAQLLPVGAIHPVFPGMAMDRATWQQSDGGAFYSVQYLFTGVIGPLPIPTYELSATMSQEPIATHPDFLALAGTPESPENNAIWEDDRFVEFGPGDLQGVSSYLVPGVEWSETSFSFTRPRFDSFLMGAERDRNGTPGRTLAARPPL